MRKKILPSDDEILERTGKSIAEWFSLIEEAGFLDKKHGEIVEWLLDEQKLPLFYANAIGHKLEEKRQS